MICFSASTSAGSSLNFPSKMAEKVARECSRLSKWILRFEYQARSTNRVFFKYEVSSDRVVSRCWPSMVSNTGVLLSGRSYTTKVPM
ncbi:hypothetical protein D3C86_1873660 [compost metagenome]